jgi:hypothetical protein
MKKTFIEIFENQKGYLQAKQLSGRNQYYQLKKMVESGEVLMIKRGLYKHTKIGIENDWTEVSKIVPAGILCLFSAWQFYELTTHISAEYHIAIPGKSRIKLPSFPPIKLYYWITDYYNMGKSIENGIVIYNLERSVCDAVKFRNKVGKDITSEVLRNYLNRNDRNIDLLIKYSKELRVETILKSYLEVML